MSASVRHRSGRRTVWAVVVASLAGAPATTGCGSAWCSMCPPEAEPGPTGDSSGTAGSAGYGTGGGLSKPSCPTSPLQQGTNCDEPERVCTARLADGQILGCTCSIETASPDPTWSCEVVACPEQLAATGDECSIYLLGEFCEGDVGFCECQWDAEAWLARFRC